MPQRLLRGVDNLIKDLDSSGASSATGPEKLSGTTAGIGKADAAGRRGDLSFLFQDGPLVEVAEEHREDARQRLDHLQADRDVRFADSNTQLRADELNKLEQDLSDISTIVRDVGVMVQAQGDQLGESSRGAAVNLANARTSAHKAAVETAKAGKARAKRRTVEGTSTSWPINLSQHAHAALSYAQDIMRRNKLAT